MVAGSQDENRRIAAYLFDLVVEDLVVNLRPAMGREWSKFYAQDNMGAAPVPGEAERKRD